MMEKKCKPRIHKLTPTDLPSTTNSSTLSDSPRILDSSAFASNEKNDDTLERKSWVLIDPITRLVFLTTILKIKLFKKWPGSIKSSFSHVVHM